MYPEHSVSDSTQWIWLPYVNMSTRTVSWYLQHIHESALAHNLSHVPHDWIVPSKNQLMESSSFVSIFSEHLALSEKKAHDDAKDGYGRYTVYAPPKLAACRPPSCSCQDSAVLLLLYNKKGPFFRYIPQDVNKMSFKMADYYKIVMSLHCSKCNSLTTHINT